MLAGFGVLIFAMAIAAAGFVATPLWHYGRRSGIVGVAFILPVFAVGMYLTVGSPKAAGIEVATLNPVETGASMSPTNRKSVRSIASLVDGLAERVDKNPDDGKSWLLLARSYRHLQRMPEAVDAYQHAALLGKHDEELASMGNAQTDAKASNSLLTGRVELASGSAHLAQATDIVFVFARAVEGPPMPVAVLRKQASELPFDFQLNDSHSLSAAAKLSDYERVVVTARITRTGDTGNALRGLEAKSEELVIADRKRLSLVIE